MKLVTVVGARPQFIKAAPVAWAIREHNRSASPKRRIDERLCHTGQHYDHGMSQQFFEELDLTKPAVDLGVGSGPHGEQTGRMLEAIERWLFAERPDRVLVYGDTNSTLAGALAASKLRIPVAHVEAGLRSFDRAMPEEVNRVLADHLSQLLLVPTAAAIENLAREGIANGVHRVGDVMYDVARKTADRWRGSGTSLLGVEPRGYYLATVHRPSNADDPDALASILGALGQLDAPVVFPVHPRTRRTLEASCTALPPNLRDCPPLGYLAMADLASSAKLILTDSGGLQKEAFFHGVPCVTLRNETEWVETVQAGWNFLAGSDTERILDAAARLSREALPRLPEKGPYGDGHAAEAIVELLCDG